MIFLFLVRGPVFKGSLRKICKCLIRWSKYGHCIQILHSDIYSVIYFSIWHSLTEIDIGTFVLWWRLTNKYVWNSGGSCEKDIECGSKGKCIDDKCFQMCKDNNDCIYDNHCANDICVPKRCQIEKDCGPGNKCTSQQCIIRCIHKGQCPDGKNCIDYYCSIPPGNHPCDLLLNMA